MHFVSDGGAYLPDAIEKSHPSHPLLRGQLDFSSEIMDVFNQGGKYKAVSRGTVGSNGVGDMLGEVGVKSMLGGHFEVVWIVGGV